MTQLAERLVAMVADPAKLRVYLEEYYGRPQKAALSSWGRVEMVLARRQPDRVPFDF